MQDPGFTKCHAITDEVQIDLNMFSALMLNGIARKIRGTDVITIDYCGTPRRMLELIEEVTEPTCLGNTISHATVLSFGA